MSTTRYARNGMSITTFAGPENEIAPHSQSRMRIQIDTDKGFTQLTMDQWIDLICFIREMDRRCEGITSKFEENFES